jgi:hypothetical protein
MTRRDAITGPALAGRAPQVKPHMALRTLDTRQGARRCEMFSPLVSYRFVYLSLDCGDGVLYSVHYNLYTLLFVISPCRIIADRHLSRMLMLSRASRGADAHPGALPAFRI